jgi:DNA uptake protein ComE-like DNA-binding protein
MTQRTESGFRSMPSVGNGTGVSAQTQDQTAAAVLVAVLFLVVSALLPLHPRKAPRRIPVDQRCVGLVQRGVDPNTARWFELAQLPRLGETVSRRIVDFRESRLAARGPDEADYPVFAHAADLTQVRGIGGRTVARMAPFLRMPERRSGD